MKEKIIKIQEEYFDILCNYFGELINIESEKHDIDTSIRSYLLKQKPIYISGYKDSDSYKRHLFFETIDRFWKKNETVLLNFIKEKKNVGIFGIGDSTFASKYCEEIGRNSLFYDVIILGDPFDTGYSTSGEYDTDHNIKAICANVLYMWKIKEFILDKEQEVFVLIFPLNHILKPEIKERIYDESVKAGTEWINDVFGFYPDSNMDNIVKGIKILKDLSLEDIQKKLVESGIGSNIAEAMNYTQNMLTESEKRFFEKFCFESWGGFNRDFLKSVLAYQSLCSITITLFIREKEAFCVANELSSNPIIGSDEWAPLLRDLKDSFLQASPNYMYTCAIHRNDKMSSLMFLEPNEVKTMHSKKNIEEYRELFYSATSDIEYAYGDVDKIANEVFIKLDEAIDNELKNKKVKRKKERWSSIIGFVKGGMGFVPILSYAISGWDMISSGRSIVQNLKDKESLIDHLAKNTIPK